MRGFLVVASVQAALAGCTTPTFDLDVTISPLAVGAHAVAKVRAGSCDDGECTYEHVDIDELVLDPPNVFELASPVHDGAFGLVALAEGTTTMIVDARTDDETKRFTHTLAARPVDQVNVAAIRAGMPCELPALYSVGMVAELAVELHGRGDWLHGEAFTAIVADAGAVDAGRSNSEILVLQLPETPGSVTLTSDADPSLAFPIEAFATSSIDRVELRAMDSRLIPLTSTEVVVDAFVGTRLVCGDAASRTVMTETPTICRLGTDDGTATSLTAVGLDRVRVVGVKAGRCTLRGSLGTTSLTATTSLDVTM